MNPHNNLSKYECLNDVCASFDCEDFVNYSILKIPNYSPIKVTALTQSITSSLDPVSRGKAVLPSSTAANLFQLFLLTVSLLPLLMWLLEKNPQAYTLMEE